MVYFSPRFSADYKGCWLPLQIDFSTGQMSAESDKSAARSGQMRDRALPVRLAICQLDGQNSKPLPPLSAAQLALEAASTSRLAGHFGWSDSQRNLPPLALLCSGSFITNSHQAAETFNSFVFIVSRNLQFHLEIGAQFLFCCSEW